jgi:hypothetical protein
MTPIAACIGLSVDSFLAGLAIAPAARLRGLWLRLAALFGLFDGLATFAAGVGVAPGVAWSFIAAGLAVLALGFVVRGWSPCYALPLLLSIDNLLTPLSPFEAIQAALASFMMAALGFILSDRLLGLIADVHRTLAALVIAAVSGVLLFLG